MAKLSDKDPQFAGGYDCQFVSPSDPPDCLLCLICFSMARSPQQMDCCGKVFCKDCLAENKKTSPQCPNCRRAGNSFNDKRAERDILALKVKCSNWKKGCQWTGELRSLEEHEERECDYTLIKCPNSCKSNRQIPRKDLKTHLQHQCIKRQYSCPDCGERGPFDKITTKHPQECPNTMVKCPNGGCGYTDRRSKLKLHKCLYEQVTCKYANVGCKEKRIRKNIGAHEEDSAYHLQLTSELVAKQKQEIEHLKDENEAIKIEAQDTREEIEGSREEIEDNKEKIDALYELNYEQFTHAASRIHELEQKILSLQSHTPERRRYIVRVFPFRKRKETGSTFDSRPLCSGLYGYKYSLQVLCNGGRTTRSTHISVYAYLLKGANDDSLTWPFTGTFVIQLLNQLEDRDHYTRHITFPAENKASKRVVDEESAPSGYGYSEFIAHTELGYKPAQNCQYLKNDRLFFRVFVNLPDSKPWLER